ncbi:MAG: ankyrin repeat domain-containing protein [Gammaproteobacteria bacterium]
MLKRLLEANIKADDYSIVTEVMDYPPDDLYYIVKCMVNLGLADDLEEHLLTIEQVRVKEAEKVNEMGQCCGIAAMGMQAILLDDIATYDKRVKLFTEIKPDELLKRIKEAKQNKEKKESKSAKASKDELLADIPIFVEDVALAQRPFRFAHLFEEKTGTLTNTMQSLSIVMSKKLEEKNVTRVTHFSSIFSADNLATFFQHMRRSVKGLKEPIAFVLTDADHRIVVGYNPTQSQPWSIIEGQIVQAVKFSDILDVALHVNKVFSPTFRASRDNITCFTAEIYTPEKQALELNKKINPFISHIMEQSGFKTKEVDSKGYTLIQKAACEGDPVLMKALLRNKADPNAGQKSGLTPLLIAIEYGHLSIVKLLIKHGAKIRSGKQGSTPILIAAARGHLDIAQYLLSKIFNKSDPNQPNEKGIAPITAAAAGGFVEIMKELLKHKIKLNVADEKGLDPLMFACRYGQEEAVKLLLENKLNPNEKNKIDESTSLHYAIESGNINVIKLVITKENINASKPFDIESIFKIARKQGKDEEVLQFLFKGQERNLVSSTNVCEITPLGLAVLYGQPHIVRYLLEQGANTDLVVNKDHFKHVNLISLAKVLDREDIVKILAPTSAKQVHQSAKLQYFGDKKRSKEEIQKHKVATTIKRRSSSSDS